jgi:hypothetical protein
MVSPPPEGLAAGAVGWHGLGRAPPLDDSGAASGHPRGLRHLSGRVSL